MVNKLSLILLEGSFMSHSHADKNISHNTFKISKIIVIENRSLLSRDDSYWIPLLYNYISNYLPFPVYSYHWIWTRMTK